MFKVIKKHSYPIFLMSIVIATLYFIPVFKYATMVTSGIMYPFLKMQNYAYLKTKNYFITKSDLQHKYGALKAEYEQLLQETIELKAVEHFVDRTQELAEFKQRFALDKAQLAHVMLKNIDSSEHYLLLDKGHMAGIKEDMVAIYKDTIVGRVSHVLPLYSILTLTSDKKCQVSVYAESTKTQGILQGSNSLKNASLNHVSHMSDLQEGELLFSTGEGLVYPRGFALGRIKTIENTEVSKIVRVEFLTDITSIEYVYLLEKGNY